MKKVYVILSRTGTGPSHLIGAVTHAEFTHSSLALLPSKHKLYSFARRRMHNFFVAGFIHEDTETFVFAKYSDAPCAVYALDVSDAGYCHMCETVARFDAQYKRFKYNFIGAATSQLGVRLRLKYRYTCAQFVATVLQSSGDVVLPKDASLMKPMDLIDIPGMRQIYRGPLKDISFEKPDEQADTPSGASCDQVPAHG